MPETKKYAEEMLRMQNDAARRVQEMERRQRSAGQEVNAQAPGKPRPRDPPSVSEPPPVPEQPTVPALQSEEEAERMFLLSLCLLLSAEGADEALVIALLYLIG